MQHTSRKIIFAGGLCLFLLAAQVSLISCAGPDRARSAADREMRGDPALQPEESLRRLASREQQATNLRPIVAAIPPGIEPEALAPRSDADNRAFLSLEQALRELVAAHHPEAGDNGAAADGQSNDEPAADEADPPQENAGDDASTHTEALRHYTRGRQAMLEERLYVAITELQQAAQLDPESPRIRRELARAYLAMNNQSRAMEQYAALRQIEPDDAEAVFSIGLYAANRREFETAAAILGRRLLNDEPFDHDPAADILARYTIAFSLRHLGYDRSFVQLWTLEAAELPMTGELFERTMYAARLGSIYRQRAELWRSVGDAHCRLGEYRRALDAYAISASLPSPDPAALHPRVIYANLRLGRVHSAQYELLAAINTEDGSISERDIRLCAYLTDTITAEVADHRRSARAEWPLRLLGDHVRRRYERSPDDPALARAAAALLPPAEGRRVLAEFVDRRPRDLDVVASLLAWLGARDLDSAIELTVDMVEANPDLTGQYVNRLIFEVPDPVSVLESLDQRQMHAPMERIGGDMAHSVQSRDLALAHVKARVLATLGAVGEAWQMTETYRPAVRELTVGSGTMRGMSHVDRRVSNAVSLALFRLRLVTLLEEPSLIGVVLEEIDPATAGVVFDSSETWIARTRMFQSFRRFDDAMDAVERAVSVAERDASSDPKYASQLVQARLEQARTYVEYAATLELESSRAQWAEEAVLIAERVLDDFGTTARNGDWRLSSSEIDMAFEVLLTTFGPSGILRDGPQFRDAARRLYDLDPDSRLYVRMMAEEAISQGRFDIALERAMSLYDSHPHETGAMELAMLAWTRMEQPEGMEQARQWLNDRLARKPGDPALLEMWVQVMLRLNRVDELTHTLKELHDRRPRHVTARRLLESTYRAAGRADLAFPLGEQRLLNRPQGVRREVELAALYGGVGMERQAVDRLEWAIEHVNDATYDHLLTAIAILGRIDPTDSRHDALTLGFVQHMVFERSASAPLQVYGAALRSLARKGRVDDPLFAGLVVHAAEHAQGAGESFERAVLWRNLAQALIDDDFPRAAAAAMRGRVEADVPLSTDALNFLGNLAIVADAAVQGGADQAVESVAFLSRLAARGRLPLLFGMDGPATLADALYHASLIYSILGDLRGAKYVLEALVEIEPENAMALNNLGYLRIEAGYDDAQTKRWIESAIKLEPQDSHILDTVGWLRYKQGRFDDDHEGLGALSLIRESADRAEEPSAEVYDHKGDVLWRLGRHEEAVEAWRTAERILADVARREEMVRTYHVLQNRVWGLLVADPEEMYDRDYGVKLAKVAEKLAAVGAGEQPRVAPTFAELRE